MFIGGCEYCKIIRFFAHLMYVLFKCEVFNNVYCNKLNFLWRKWKQWVRATTVALAAASNIRRVARIVRRHSSAYPCLPCHSLFLDSFAPIFTPFPLYDFSQQFPTQTQFLSLLFYTLTNFNNFIKLNAFFHVIGNGDDDEGVFIFNSAHTHTHIHSL